MYTRKLEIKTTNDNGDFYLGFAGSEEWCCIVSGEFVETLERPETPRQLANEMCRRWNQCP